MDATPESAISKPLLRGWLHAAACLAAAVAIPLLLVESDRDPAKLAAMGGFGLTMVLLYAVSAVYHIGDWGQNVKRRLAKLDYANIFLFIAASNTALCVLALPSEHYLPRLALIWLFGFAGIGCVVALPCLRRRARTALYVLVGWAGALSTSVLQTPLATPALVMISASALAYLIGGDRLCVAAAEPAAAGVRLPRAVPPADDRRERRPRGRLLDLAPPLDAERPLTGFRREPRSRPILERAPRAREALRLTEWPRGELSAPDSTTP